QLLNLTLTVFAFSNISKDSDGSLLLAIAHQGIGSDTDPFLSNRRVFDLDFVIDHLLPLQGSIARIFTPGKRGPISLFEPIELAKFFRCHIGSKADNSLCRLVEQNQLSIIGED